MSVSLSQVTTHQAVQNLTTFAVTLTSNRQDAVEQIRKLEKNPSALPNSGIGQVSGTRKAETYVIRFQAIKNGLIFLAYFVRRNVWSMRWRTRDQEVDQTGLGQRLCKKIVKHVI